MHSQYGNSTETKDQSTSLIRGIVRVRPMQEVDLTAVIKLEKQSYLFPWPSWIMRRALRTGFSCWVVERRGEILGYGIMSMRKELVHIMNMCVAKRYRSQGIGRRILIQMLVAARAHNCVRAWLEVRPNNYSAIHLYKRLGFRKIGMRKNYYPARWGRQHALIMTRQL